jgi:hypothetical protein
MPTAVHAEPPLSQASPCKAPSPATSGTGCRVHAAPFHVVVPGHGAPGPLSVRDGDAAGRLSQGR